MSELPKLTEQQDRALRLILGGARQAKIAKVLGVSRSRTREIVLRVCEKYDVWTMAEIPDAHQALLEDAEFRTGDSDDDGRIHA